MPDIKEPISIEINEKDNQMMILVDLNGKPKLSSTGKTYIFTVGKARQFTVNGTTWNVGLNVYKYAEPK